MDVAHRHLIRSPAWAMLTSCLCFDWSCKLWKPCSELWIGGSLGATLFVGTSHLSCHAVSSSA